MHRNEQKPTGRDQKNNFKLNSCVMFHLSCVTYHISRVTCCMSPVTCHLSLTATATAADLHPDNFSTMPTTRYRGKLVCKDPQTKQNLNTKTIIELNQNNLCLLASQY